MLLLSLLVPLAVGGMLYLVLRPGRMANPGAAFLWVCLMPGLGLGICSVFFFLWLAAFDSWRRYALTELLIAAGLAALVLWLRGDRRDFGSLLQRKRSSAGVRLRWLEYAFWLALLADALVFCILSVKAPDGGFDGWALWTMKARFMFRDAGVHWRDVYTPLLAVFHPDYPLLIPGTIARSWAYMGRGSAVVQVLVAAFFTFATVGVTVGALSILRNRAQGFLAGLVLLGTPFLVTLGASQYADVPLAFFFVSTLALLAIYRQEEKNRGILVLAGLTAALSAWTKNEGLLFVVVLVFLETSFGLWRRDTAKLKKDMAAIAVGLAPVLLAVVFFKLRYAPPNDLVSGQGLQTVGRLMAAHRYKEIASSMVKEFSVYGFGEWSVNVVPILPFYLLLVHRNSETGNRTGIQMGVLSLLGMLAGYCVVYLTTPNNLAWQLRTSLDRLLLQLWPSAVFVFFLAAGSLPSFTEGGQASMKTEFDSSP